MALVYLTCNVINLRRFSLNVFKFSINILNKNNLPNNIKTEIYRKYSDNSSYRTNYKKYCIKQWGKIDKDNIRGLYSSNSIVSFVNISKNHYYLVEVDNQDSKDQISLDVFVISELDDVTDSFNIVYNDINKKLKGLKLKVIDKKALLYIYDGSDITSTDFMIKADIVKFNEFNNNEIFQLLIIGITILFAIIIAFKYNNDSIFNGCISWIVSSLLFLLSSLLMKVNFRKKKIKIKDFSKWIEKKDSVMRDYDNSDDIIELESPIV